MVGLHWSLRNQLAETPNFLFFSPSCKKYLHLDSWNNVLHIWTQWLRARDHGAEKTLLSTNHGAERIGPALVPSTLAVWAAVIWLPARRRGSWRWASIPAEPLGPLPVLPVLAVLCFGRRPSHTGCRVAACARHPQRPSARSLWSAPRLLLPWSALRPRTAGSCHCGGAGRGTRFQGMGGSGQYMLRRRLAAARGVAFLPRPSRLPGTESLGALVSSPDPVPPPGSFYVYLIVWIWGAIITSYSSYSDIILDCREPDIIHLVCKLQCRCRC